jgi:hypothetical protein
LKDWWKCLQLTVILLLKGIPEGKNMFSAAIRKNQCVVMVNMGSEN